MPDANFTTSLSSTSTIRRLRRLTFPRLRRFWSQPDRYPGEPIFVGPPVAGAVSSGAEQNDEDKGVLLSVVLDAAGGKSFLLALDARDVSELARAHTPHHIPFSFHGQFART